MKPQINARLFESAIATYWFDEDGILYLRAKNTPRTQENSKENYELIKRICDNKKVCVIMDTSDGAMASIDIRKSVTASFPDYFKAIAFISKSTTGKMISLFFVVLQKTGLPMSTFSNETEAKEWLRKYL